MNEFDLRTFLRQTAEQYDVRYDLPTSVAARTRLRLIAKAVLVVAIVVTVAWTATGADLASFMRRDPRPVNPASSGEELASPVITPDDETRGYRFSNVSVEKANQVPGNEAPSDLVLVRFDYSWKTATFPGFRDCLFTVYDISGESIGEESRLVGFEESDGSSLREVRAQGDPASAHIECGRRLPHEDRYEISDVRIHTTSAWEIVATFDTRWTGDQPVPGESRCVASVFDENGRPIVGEEFTFSTEAGERNDMPLSLEAPSATGEQAAKADIVCY